MKRLSIFFLSLCFIVQSKILISMTEPAAPAALTRTASRPQSPGNPVLFVRTGSGESALSPKPNLAAHYAIDFASWHLYDVHPSGHDLTGKRPGPLSLQAILQKIESHDKTVCLVSTQFTDPQYHDKNSDKTRTSWLNQTALHRVSRSMEFPPTYVYKVGEREFYEKLPERQLAIAQILLDYGADLLARDSQNRTPLHIVASTGRQDLLKLYIEHIELYAHDNSDYFDARGGKNNSTPLMAAIIFHKNHNARVNTIDNRRCIEILLSHGAHVNLHNSNNQTALDLASDPEYPERAELIPMLVHAGAKTAHEIVLEAQIHAQAEEELLEQLDRFHPEA